MKTTDFVLIWYSCRRFYNTIQGNGDMNIGIFTDTYLPEANGVAVSTKILKDEFEKLGHNAYIVTTSNPHRKHAEDGVFTLPSMPLVFTSSRRLGTLYSNRVRRIIKRLDLEIVHTHTEFSIGLFGKINAFALRIPVVHTYHTIYRDYGHYLKIARFKKLTGGMAKTITKTYCTGCKAIIAPTKKTYNLLDDYGLKNEKHIIPTGINLSKFDEGSSCAEEVAGLRKSHGIGDNEKVLLNVGRVAKEKSIDVIIRAFPGILEKSPGVKLVIVGDGPALNVLISLCRELGISENVVFTGEVPWTKIAAYYRIGDVFISASKSETQGLTFIEAMASGLPVISIRDECLEGIIEDKETGFVFDDENELPELINRILNDKGLRLRICQNALLTSQRFSCENYAKNVLKVYKSVLKAKT